MGETTRSQDHAARGLDGHLTTVTQDLGTDHRALVLDQLVHRRVKPHRDVQVERRLGQSPDQGVAVGQGHPATQLEGLPEVLGEALGGVDRRLDRAGGAHEVLNVVARADHHAEYRQLRQRRFQLVHALTQLTGIERPGDHGAPTLGGPRRLGMVVGEGQRHVELHGRVLGEEVDRLAAALQEGIHPLFVIGTTALVLEVGLDRLRCVGMTPGLAQSGAGNPQPTARTRRGTTVGGALFDHQHIQPVVLGGDRRRHTCRTSTHHQYVTAVGFLLCHGVLQPLPTVRRRRLLFTQPIRLLGGGKLAAC
ncbi:hypothetical protein D3C80_1212720 [compost metagenome]